MKLVAWNTVLTLVLGLLALVGAEAYLRWTIPPMQEGQLYEYRADSKRYKLMKPSTSMKLYGVEVRTNDLGFRDKRAAIPAKQPNEFRVIVIGDSFTFGPGVDYERLYTSLLERKLQRAYPQLTVINLAVEGYNILQYQAVLEEVGLGLQPDAVVVSLFPVNDFELEGYSTHYQIATGHPPPPAPWYQSYYVYRAYLYRAEEVALKALHRLVPSATADGPDYGWDKNIAALDQIAALTRARGLPLTIALLPHTKGFRTQKTIFGRVNAHCRVAHLPCVDLLDPLRASGVRDGAWVLNAVDSHPNVEYNRFIAERLAPYVGAMLRKPLTGPAAGA
jgi:GDSL-like lipase/acylhydrolase family protein